MENQHKVTKCIMNLYKASPFLGKRGGIESKLKGREETLKKLDFEKPALNLGCGDSRHGEMINVDITQGDVISSATHLPFKSDSFKFIFLASLLEYMQDIDEFLLELKRVSVNGTIIVIKETIDSNHFRCVMISHILSVFTSPTPEHQVESFKFLQLLSCMTVYERNTLENKLATLGEILEKKPSVKVTLQKFDYRMKVVK